MAIHSPGGVRRTLRAEVETCASLITLYDELLALVSALPESQTTELRSHAQTSAFRSQLADALPGVKGPYVDLAFRRALCSIIDQCEEEEVYHLGFAMILHFGGQVEMYVRAVEVDPDHRMFRAVTIQNGIGVHRERPRLINIGTVETEDESSEEQRSRSGRGSLG